MQMTFHRKLPIPQEVKKAFPVTEEMRQAKEKRDDEIRAVFVKVHIKTSNAIRRV